MGELTINELAERKVRTVSESLESDGILKIKLYVTGFQFVLNLIECNLYNFPFGHSYGLSLENSPILRLIFLNLSRLGRGNSLALDGTLTMPRSSGKLVDKIAGAHESFSKWSAGKPEPLLADVLNRGLDIVEKQSRETSKNDYVFLGWWVPDFFLDWWRFLVFSPGLVGVSTIN